MDIDQNVVVSTMGRHQVQQLIHGHAHRPTVYELIANQQPAFRVVLGTWHTEGSMMKAIADDVELIHFPFQKTRSFIDFMVTQPFSSLPFRVILCVP